MKKGSIPQGLNVFDIHIQSLSNADCIFRDTFQMSSRIRIPLLYSDRQRSDRFDITPFGAFHKSGIFRRNSNLARDIF